ncbi:MAG: hypothetical protein A3H76_06255 [Candidatus Lloydbacteria bacterium RIFCSPLOWO2_02_FULL_54_12]|nr:MAG: hypothetical protein A3H76_06255 [Candidatus Lloydbacteria bacterium RIFCSPLOWO2_02_FULL_54_12]
MNLPSPVVVREEGSGHHFSLAHPDPVLGKERAPIVFIHGAGGAAWHWDSLLPHFAACGYPCYAPDLVGHGVSRESIRTAGIYDYALDVEHFLTNVVLPRHSAPVVVGHSMGGLIAQKIAESVATAGVVLVTPAPPHGISYRPGGVLLPAPEDILSLFCVFIMGQSIPLSRKFIESIFVDPIASAAVIDTFVAKQFVESPIALKEMLLGEVTVRPEMITCPIFVVGAGKDRVIHPEIAHEVAEYYDAPLATLHHLGHACIMEAGCEATAGVILGWLSSSVCT